MGQQIDLTAADGHKFKAYLAEPSGTPIAGLVVLQEIFGVNSHMRHVTDDYAKLGFRAISPALFDRSERGIELGYTPDDVVRGRDLRATVPLDGTLADIDACMKFLGTPKVGVIGYCWGGGLAWLAATRLKPQAAVSYYGGMVAPHAAEKPVCPVIFHFGETDASIPMSDVKIVQDAHPELPLYVYKAGHGFSCNDRAAFEPASAKLAEERSVAFLKSVLS